MKVAIVAIAKWENHYIREFISHYKNLGVDNIIIGDNNEVDGEHIEAVIQDFIDEGLVVVKNYRGQIMCQIKFYTDMYKEYGGEYDWLGFFDCDEFLHLNIHENVKDFLSDSRYDNFKIIRLNWQCYGDDGLIKVEDGNYSMQDRFVTPLDKDIKVAGLFANSHSKIFIRGNLGKMIFIGVHGNYSIRECCNDTGKLIDNKALTHRISWEVAYLKHYITKTLEEWLIKMKRGYPDKNHRNSNMLSVRRFFMYNKTTDEKLEFLKSKGKTAPPMFYSPFNNKGVRNFFSNFPPFGPFMNKNKIK